MITTAMPEDLGQRASSYSRLLRLITMVRIRWFAISCQTAAVVFVAFYLQFSLPLVSCLLLIGSSACLNIFLVFRYNTNHRLSPAGTTFILGMDVLLLSGLLYFTGGLTNPFALLLLAPAGLGATSLVVRNIVVLNCLVIAAVTFLAMFHYPLPWYSGIFLHFPPLLIEGMWIGICAALIFTTSCSYYVAEEARRLADALTATELILQQEQHLSALDGLAAAAAHELGTPLSTIQLVARELQHQLADEPEMAEDIDLLVSQTQRCRDILGRLASLSTEGGMHMVNMPLTGLIEEVVAPHRDFGVEIVVQGRETSGAEPMFHRNPGVLYSIGNLVENAVDFARSQVSIDYQWTEKSVALTITDDGCGFPVHMLDRIGEPYMRGRETNRQNGGLGLGVFIAKTLIERSGAHIRFGNSKNKERGAEIKIIWSRTADV